MNNADNSIEFSEVNERNGNVHEEKIRKGWVQFDDEQQTPTVSHSENEIAVTKTPPVASTQTPTRPTVPAVLNTETVHVNLERGDKNLESSTQSTLTKNVEFVNVRHGFCKFDNCINFNEPDFYLYLKEY